MPSTGTPISKTAIGAFLLARIDRVRPAGQDDALRAAQSSDTSKGWISQYLLLAHAAGDELGDLGAEIEDQDFLVHSGFHRVKTLIANYSP
jgi:hypothetical protein